MGQFKPMVKMETTEPSVELKLKKGGHVNMKKGGKAEAGHKKMAMGGGALDMMSGTPALVGRPAVNAPVRAPGKPSMASRRKSMMAKKPMPAMKPSAPPMAMPPMKKGGKAEGGESKAAHKAEMSAIKGVDKKLTKHASMAASKGHKGLKTGGVALGNAGGFKKGGMATGGVKIGNGGGYKTGGVSLGNAGGFKAGGKTSKKAYATGGTVNSGKPVAMPQGAKKPSSPVSTNRVAGTFKKGGKVTPAEGNLMKAFGAENKTAMKQAKAQSNDVYSKYQKMQKGGSPTPDERFFDKNKVDPKFASDKASRELEEAMNPLGMVKELYGKARDAFRGQGSVSDKERNMLSNKKESMPSLKGQGAITETERSVTVSPAGKKRGGRAC
jgi:hypothetical protein